MNKYAVSAALALCALNSSAMTFEEAAAICKKSYELMENPTDDGDKSFSTPGRINVAFTVMKKYPMVCSVGIESKELEEVKHSRGVMSKEELRAAKEKSAKEHQELERVVAGDNKDFVKKAKRVIADKFKDPDSVRFRDLYLANKGLPALCGEVNAKNSYGGYTGYKGFFYNPVQAYIDDQQELGEGFMYKNLQPGACKDKFADVE
ncbi:hypothetical protein [Comamonas sp.]|uniref:hypothetical protein n=1 Tax=Comamonas sp. TaxID=34028 RepID=UPI00289BC177|nr:hypothetical protein [Comamonas sp.]